MTVSQTREPRKPELPQPEDDWTDAQPREVEMTDTDPGPQQRGNDNDEQSDLSELDEELKCEPCPVCLAESVLGDQLGISGGVTILWIGHEAFVQPPGDLQVNGEHVTIVTGMRGTLLMTINENRRTLRCSHCSNLVLDDDIVTICADRDPCRCPCHKLLT